MKKVINTTTKDSHVEWLFGGNPDAIVAQEAEGQKELIESLQLPRKCSQPRDITNASEQYQKMGIKVFPTSKGDELFIGVKLPDGWKKEATEHEMWNNLIDDKGRTRATFFYKAAFYDRKAFVNFNHRYVYETKYLQTRDDAKSFPKFYCVKDTINDEILFKTEVSTEYYDEHLVKQCIEFLQVNYPNYNDVNAIGINVQHENIYCYRREWCMCANYDHF